MKNKREIVESKYPPRNNEDIWLKDLLLYASTTKGWLPLGSEKTYSNKTELLQDTPAGGTIGIDKETGIAYLYNDVSKEWTPVGDVGESITLVTWQELKDKRDAGKLTPGALYRITDYNCTTTQENTQSAGHQFDIVLLALSEDKLAEEGWAMEHPTDVYDVTFADGVTKKCYWYLTGNDGIDNIGNLVDIETLLGVSKVAVSELTIDEENKTIDTNSNYGVGDLSKSNLTYKYFQNSNLSAWKVWYSLDNDTDRFAWASNILSSETNNPMIIVQYGEYYSVCVRQSQLDNEKGCAWVYSGNANNFDGDESLDLEDIVYTQLTNPNIGDIALHDHAEIGNLIVHNISIGRGVIYRLIDEFNNDIKYDFKNIQFKRKLTDGQYDATNGTETWCYTLNIWYEDMCQDASIVGNTLTNDEGFVSGVYDNKFGYATAYDVYIEGVSTFAFALGNNVVLSIFEGDYYGIYSNTIGNNFTNNTIGNYFGENIIGTSFSANTIGNDFYSNTIGNNFMDNTIGNSVNYNMIGNSFGNKTISDNTSGKNYGNNGVELATKNDIGDIETALNNI